MQTNTLNGLEKKNRWKKNRALGEIFQDEDLVSGSKGKGS